MRWNLGFANRNKSSFRNFNSSVHPAELLRPIVGSKVPISVNGYLRRAETEDFVMFSESLRSASWIRVAVRNVRALEYFGQEAAPGGDCAKVRLTF